MFRMHTESLLPHEDESPELPEGFELFPDMIELRENLMRNTDDILDLNHTFEVHIAMLHRTLPDELLYDTAMYHILCGDYDKAIRSSRFDLEGEDYSICDFLKSLQPRHD